MTDTFTNTRGIPDNAVLPPYILSGGPIPPLPSPDPAPPVQSEPDPAPVAVPRERRIARLEVEEPSGTESIHCGTYRWTKDGQTYQAEFFVTVPPADGSEEMQAIREDTYNRQALIQDEKLWESGAVDVQYTESFDCTIF